QSFVDNRGLRGARIGVVREFMKSFSKADEDSIRIGNRAIADLAKAGATIVDPGPDGALFGNAIAELLPGLDAPMLAAVYKEVLFPSGTAIAARSVDVTGKASALPSELSLRILSEYQPPSPGEVLYVL